MAEIRHEFPKADIPQGSAFFDHLQDLIGMGFDLNRPIDIQQDIDRDLVILTQETPENPRGEILDQGE